MTTAGPGRPHRGRRDNGLDAAVFVAVADVDPRVGEHLLDAFGLAGIAAYLTPSVDLHPVVRSTVLPSRPTDRLWVDRDRRQQAWDLLAQVNPDEPPATGGGGAGGRSEPAPDVDAEWERIIAGYTAPSAAGRAWPLAEDADESTSDPLSASRAPDAVPPDAEPYRDVGAGRPDPDAPEGDEGYTPPPPPPLPRLSGHVVIALAAIVAGLVLFFRPDLLGRTTTTALIVAAMCIIGGFGALVYRLHDTRPDEDDPDDGAVV